jgi:hypothetical protein
MPRSTFHKLLLISCLAVPSVVSAQVVQLPTFRFTTVNTTVSVPDRGAVYLGGVNRAATASTSRGVPLLGKVPGLGPLTRSRGISRTTSASSTSVHATIIDHAELDRQVLAEAARRRLVSGDRNIDPILNRRADFLSRNIGRNIPSFSASDTHSIVERAPSVEDIRRRNESAEARRNNDAVSYYEKGQSALANGKRGAAKVYFNMAARRASGDLKSQVEDALADLSGVAARSSVASAD